MHDSYKNGDTDITVILDRSGSMGSVVDTTIEGFNKFLREQQDIPGRATITLVQFDDQYQVDYENRNINSVNYLNKETYVPRGMTALLDAIGKTIHNIEHRVIKNKPSKVIVVIQTDGLENASREFKLHQINDTISHLRNQHKWEFIFLGANQDAIKTAESYGILHTHAMTYINGGEITAFSCISNNIANYRSNLCDTAGFTKEDKEEGK